MSKKVQLVTQSGADTFTTVAIPTDLTADGRAGWQINSIMAHWVDGAAVVPGDWQAHAKLATTTNNNTFGADDELARVSWGLQNTAAAAVAVAFEPIKSFSLIEPRITVQPNIYAQVESSATGQANDMIIVVFYELVKLSDIEVLRLLAGGA